MIYKHSRNLKIFFLLLIFPLLFQIGYSEEFKEDYWVNNPLPKYPSEDWYKANRSTGWKVFKKDNKLNVVKFSKRSRSYIIEVHNGSLIGTDRGEWGGELYWESNSGTSKYKIVNGNFKKHPFMTRYNKQKRKRRETEPEKNKKKKNLFFPDSEEEATSTRDNKQRSGEKKYQ